MLRHWIRGAVSETPATLVSVSLLPRPTVQSVSRTPSNMIIVPTYGYGYRPWGYGYGVGWPAYGVGYGVGWPAYGWGWRRPLGYGWGWRRPWVY